MVFDRIDVGTRTIQRILDRADRIVPGRFPELIRQAGGSFVCEDSAPFELLIR